MRIHVIIVAGTADVVPKSNKRKNVGLFLCFQPIDHQLIKAVGLPDLKLSNDASVETINSHAHIKRVLRLFRKRNEVVVVAVKGQDPKIDLLPTAASRHGYLIATRAVKIKKAFEIQVTDEVTIHHKKVFGQITNQGERANCPQRSVFLRIINFQPPLKTVPKKSADQVSHMIDRDGYVLKAIRLQLSYDNLENGHLPPNGHKRFRNHGGVRGQPRPFSARQNNRSHNLASPSRLQAHRFAEPTELNISFFDFVDDGRRNQRSKLRLPGKILVPA